jgi:membrane protein YqaA with SNARE-associated domain
MSEVALLFSAFLAATIFPFSSELAFVTAIANDMPKSTAIIVASIGNVLAIIVNYWFGYWLYEKTHNNLEKSKVGKSSLEYGKKYGYPILLFSWLPVIGDPLTLVAGVLRLNFVVFLVIAGTLRVARYVAIAYFAM